MRASRLRSCVAKAPIWDEAGKRYLDAVAGVAVNGLGHAHPKLVKAIADQAASLIHSSNLYRVPRQENWPTGCANCRVWTAAFFLKLGLRANEAAIKLRACMATQGPSKCDHYRDWKRPSTAAPWRR